MITPEQLSNPNVETSEQKALFCWAALNWGRYPQLKWLHAIPNANSHRMVAEGVRGGVPDVCLPVPIEHYHKENGMWLASYHGLYIEMKIEKRRKEKNGGLQDNQIEWLDYLSSAGYKCHVCYGWQEARKAIEEYLGA